VELPCFESHVAYRLRFSGVCHSPPDIFTFDIYPAI